MSEAQNFKYTEFDKLLATDGPVMIVGRQLLKPASLDETSEIVFPPSYAGSEKSSEGEDDSGDSVYNIDPPYDPRDPATHKNVCVLDSIPSQANRMEPIFKRPEYQALVPQYQIKFTTESDELPVNILDIGHRIADSAFRGTTIRAEIVAAFKKYAKGDAIGIAKLGPTSLLFGAWDSRGTGVKIPRLINSIIRAFDVVPRRRSAQYSPPINCNREGLLPDGLTVKPTKYGLAPVPAPLKIGGIEIKGDIRRDFSLNLDLLRRLKAPLSEDQKESIRQEVKVDPAIEESSRDTTVKQRTDEAQRNADLKLQRYVLGLALLAFTATPESTLRQGCQLLPKANREWKVFRANGEDENWALSEEIIEKSATEAAADFVVVRPAVDPLVFDKSLLKTSIEADAKQKAGTPLESESPVETISKLIDGLKISTNGKKLNDAPLKKLTDYLATLSDGPEKAFADSITRVIQGDRTPQEKIDEIKSLPAVQTPSAPAIPPTGQPVTPEAQ